VQHDLAALGLLLAELFLRRPMVITSSRVMLAELSALPMALQPLVSQSSVPPSHWEAVVLPLWGGDAQLACAECTTP
jgi:hypothetical protein